MPNCHIKLSNEFGSFKFEASVGDALGFERTTSNRMLVSCFISDFLNAGCRLRLWPLVAAHLGLLALTVF